MEIRRTDAFDKWLRKLKDNKDKEIIQVHINRLIEDNPGKLRSLGKSVYEKKINYGPGYRLYVVKHSKQAVVLLCGGDKSTQVSDIEQAQALAKEVRKRIGGKL